jgi:uncharacterized membrane protein
MTPKHFIAVCLRLFALWLVIGGFQVFAIAEAVKQVNEYLIGDPVWLIWLVMAVFLVTAFLLWILSAPIATKLLSGVPAPKAPGLSMGDIIVAGCVLMGLWWLKEALIPLFSLWLRAFALSGDHSVIDLLGPAGKVSTVLHLIEIVIGLFFVLRPFDIAKWVAGRIPSHGVETERQIGE